MKHLGLITFFPLFFLTATNMSYATPLEDLEVAICELGIGPGNGLCIQSGRKGWNDETWKSSDTFSSGWTEKNFTAGWGNAYSFETLSGGQTPNDIFNPITTNSNFMWHDESTSPQGGVTGSLEAYFRYEFDLGLPNGMTIGNADATIQVDDDFKFYINEIEVHSNHDGGYADLVETINIAEYLDAGTNVFAIHAVDGSWTNGSGDPNPYFRVSHDVLFDASISFKAVSEPNIITLFLLALGTLSISSFKKR